VETTQVILDGSGRVNLLGRRGGGSAGRGSPEVERVTADQVATGLEMACRTGGLDFAHQLALLPRRLAAQVVFAEQDKGVIVR
jgi:hypothetical protein